MEEKEGGAAILSSAGFRLGVLGAQITRAFSARIEGTGLTHKQVGLLAVVDAGAQRVSAVRFAHSHVDAGQGPSVGSLYRTPSEGAS